MAATLLLVDDEPRNLYVLEACLRPHGYQTLGAENGERALRLIETAPVDLVITDVRMPVMDGLALIAAIRARPASRYLPVVVATASGERDARLRAAEAGADEFLEKPLESGVLLARVRTLLRLQDAMRQLQARNEELLRHQALHRETSEFIVHDLKSPLTAISANASWVRESLPPGCDELAEALADVEAATQRLRAMAEDMLTAVRLDAPTPALARDEVPLGALARAVVAARSREAEGRLLRCEAEFRGGPVVRGDAALLTRLLENLVDNALRHTPPGGRVEVRAERDGARVRLAVANDGAPIPPTERGTIFEKFRRGSLAGPSARNTGLGLYFCRRVAESHGGSISVLDSPDWPVCFAVDLPAAVR